MSLGKRVGKACEKIMDEKMRGLACTKIQMDEIWGFVGKNQRNLKFSDDRREVGDVWTFVSVDANSRMVPNYFIGKRSSYSANYFVEDLAARLDSERVPVSSDALSAYVEAVERGFGSEANYGQIVKTYSHTDLAEQRRYCPPEILTIKRTVISGNPDIKSISTSYVERQNLTMRMRLAGRGRGFYFEGASASKGRVRLEEPGGRLPLESPNTAVRAAIAAKAR
jgi:IS1 family transposase